MISLNFFSKKDGASAISKKVKELLAALRNEYIKIAKIQHWGLKINHLDSYLLLAELTKTEQKEFFVQGCDDFLLFIKNPKSIFSTNEYYHETFYQELLKYLGTIQVSISEKELLEFVVTINSVFSAQNQIQKCYLVSAFLNKLDYGIETTENIKIKDAILALKCTHPYDGQIKKLNEKLDYLLKKNRNLDINEKDALGKHIISFLNNLENINLKDELIELCNILASVQDKASPSQKWIKEVSLKIESIGKKEVQDFYLTIIKVAYERLKDLHKIFDREEDYNKLVYLTEVNVNFLKGLIWSTSHFESKNEIFDHLDEYATIAYKKIPNFGSLSIKTGNACMYVFGKLTTEEAISRLTKFKQKIKNNSILSQIEKQIKALADSKGITIDVLEEIAVSSFGFNSDGVFKQQIGEAVLQLSFNNKLELDTKWLYNNKLQNSIPSLIKEVYKEELAKLKKTIKSIESAGQTQRGRLEQVYLKNRSWTVENWLKYYINHPFINNFARKLIWNLHNKNEETKQVFYYEGKLIDSLGFEVNFNIDDTEVTLWHPIHSPAEDVFAWRSFLYEKEILQPFKQAYREIYLVTDAELRTDTYSNRFAAHVLRQHQLAALCKQRGWQYTLQGQWDSYNYPVYNLKNWNIRAEFFLEADWNGQASQSGVFNYILTDQVRFYEFNEQIRIENVPPMVFTELMRDIDLFVGVCSIGNDPNWRDQGDGRANSYWQNYSYTELSESGKVRAQTLKSLISRLKIASRCQFDGKYLIVKGNLKTYKIHLGSGNILMQPNDQYLCIVPDRTDSTKEKLFLPFEGDNLLSIILSKALLLSEDDKITDKSITHQLKS